MPTNSADGRLDRSLSVVSFNIRADTLASRVLDGANIWHNRKQRVLNVLREVDCDIVGLQECVDHQWQWLQPKLARDYDSYAVGSDGRRKGELCPLLWKRGRFELLAHDTFWINPRQEPHRRMPHARRRRICSWVRLGDMRSGAALTVYNTHFDHRPGATGDMVREQSAAIVLREMEDQGLTGSILMGDLNSPPDCSACKVLRHELVDTYEAAHPRGGSRQKTFHLWSGRALGVMDYIYVTPDIDVEASGVVYSRGGPGEAWPSDHFPVAARLRV